MTETVTKTAFEPPAVVSSLQTTTTKLGEKRYRPSPSLYRFTYSSLVERDGETCQVCSTGPPLDVDHKDGHKETWTLSHLRLLCRACNVSLQFRTAPSVKEREKKGEGGSPWPDAAYEIRRHYQLETDCEKALDHLLDLGPVTVKEAEDRISQIVGSTQVVVRRWIDRAVTPEGSFSLSERQVSDGRKTRTQQYLGRKRVL